MAFRIASATPVIGVLIGASSWPSERRASSGRKSQFNTELKRKHGKRVRTLQPDELGALSERRTVMVVMVNAEHRSAFLQAVELCRRYAEKGAGTLLLSARPIRVGNTANADPGSESCVEPLEGSDLLASWQAKHYLTEISQAFDDASSVDAASCMVETKTFDPLYELKELVEALAIGKQDGFVELEYESIAATLGRGRLGWMASGLELGEGWASPATDEAIRGVRMFAGHHCDFASALVVVAGDQEVQSSELSAIRAKVHRSFFGLATAQSAPSMSLIRYRGEEGSFMTVDVMLLMDGIRPCVSASTGISASAA